MNQEGREGQGGGSGGSGLQGASWRKGAQSSTSGSALATSFSCFGEGAVALEEGAERPGAGGAGRARGAVTASALGAPDTG